MISDVKVILKPNKQTTLANIVHTYTNGATSNALKAEKTEKQ